MTGLRHSRRTIINHEFSMNLVIIAMSSTFAAPEVLTFPRVTAVVCHNLLNRSGFASGFDSAVVPGAQSFGARRCLENGKRGNAGVPAFLYWHMFTWHLLKALDLC